MDFSEELKDKTETPTPAKKKIPGKAVQLIDNNVVEEKPFVTNDDLPEAELYFGGEFENDSEHHQRMIKLSQQEEMSRL